MTPSWGTPFLFQKGFDLIKINFDYVDHSYKLFIIKYVQMYIALLGWNVFEDKNHFFLIFTGTLNRSSTSIC